VFLIDCDGRKRTKAKKEGVNDPRTLEGEWKIDSKNLGTVMTTRVGDGGQSQELTTS